MKFKSPETHPNQIVWDSIKLKALCEFKDGELETEDEGVIKILADLGYSYEGELPVKERGVEPQVAINLDGKQIVESNVPSNKRDKDKESGK